MTKKLIKITKDILYELYIIKSLKMKEIAKKLNCSITMVSLKIKEFGIKQNTDSKYINKKFGMLTPIKRSGKDSVSHSKYICRCDCGNEVELAAYSFSGKNINTSSCGCLRRRIGKNNPRYKGYEGISQTLWSSLIDGAKNRNLKFDISKKFAWELFLSQNKKCAISGEDINFIDSRKTGKYTTASLDRIDSNLGYIKGNVQWVHKKVNKLKLDMSDQELINWCHIISDYQKKIKE